MNPTPLPLWLSSGGCSSGATRDCIEKLHQGQGDKDSFYANSCASFSEAMTLNLLYNSNYQGGTIARENQASFYGLDGNLGIEYGIPPYIHVNMINDRLKRIATDNPNLTRYEAVYTRNNSPEDLITNLEEGNATIVFVSWDTNADIWEGEDTGVGHAMSFVGYDTTQDEFHFLDPAKTSGEPIETYTRDELEGHWLETSNAFIPAGSMITYEEMPNLLSSHPEPISAPNPSDTPSAKETPSPITQENGEMP